MPSPAALSESIVTSRVSGAVALVTFVTVVPFVVYLTSSNSTSKTSVAFGGMTPPAPRAP
jgi:hypothetical protein